MTLSEISTKAKPFVGLLVINNGGVWQPAHVFGEPEIKNSCSPVNSAPVNIWSPCFTLSYLD